MVVHGTAMAVMNLAYYCAVGRLPLGVAATLLFPGPVVVAVASARAWREALLPAVGLAGVVLVTEPGGTVEWAGIAFGLLSAPALACYTVFAQRVGRASSGLEGLAVSVCISAILLLPFSVPAAPSVNGSGWGLVAVSGVVGVALAFTLDFQAVMAGAKRAQTGVGGGVLGSDRSERAETCPVVASAAPQVTDSVTGLSSPSPAYCPEDRQTPLPG